MNERRVDGKIGMISIYYFYLRNFEEIDNNVKLLLN